MYKKCLNLLHIFNTISPILITNKKTLITIIGINDNDFISRYVINFTYVNKIW